MSSKCRAKGAITLLSALLIAGTVQAAPSATADRIHGFSKQASTSVSTSAGGSTWFGSTAQRRSGETYRQALRRTDRTFGNVEAVRVFHSGLPDSWTELRHDFGRRGLIVSFKANPVKVNSGKYDRFFRNWFRRAPKNRRTYWTYFHEPEDNIAAGQFTARQYRAAWRRLARLARSNGSGRLKSTLILMAWSLNPASGRNWRHYYPRKAIDVLGWDAYNYGERKNRYVRPRKLFKRITNISRRQNRPFGIAEFGSLLVRGDNGSRRAKWLRSAGRYLARKNAAFVTYFDSDVGGDFRLLDRPSQRGWRQVVNKVG